MRFEKIMTWAISLPIDIEFPFLGLCRVIVATGPSWETCKSTGDPICVVVIPLIATRCCAQYLLVRLSQSKYVVIRTDMEKKLRITQEKGIVLRTAAKQNAHKGIFRFRVVIYSRTWQEARMRNAYKAYYSAGYNPSLHYARRLRQFCYYRARSIRLEFNVSYLPEPMPLSLHFINPPHHPHAIFLHYYFHCDHFLPFFLHYNPHVWCSIIWYNKIFGE